MNTERSEDALRQLLEKQYRHAEEYCNSQTRLHQALASSGGTPLVSSLEKRLNVDSIKQAMKEMMECGDAVRSDLQDLALYTDNKVVQEHLETSRRVVRTIYQSGGRLHANGIPAGKDDFDTKMIALATLRASLAKVKSLCLPVTRES